jgi:DNA-nicking Smr family endonuclease
MARNLSPDEAALWAKVMASVRPLKAASPAATPKPQPVRSAASRAPTPKPTITLPPIAAKPTPVRRGPPVTFTPASEPVATTLDGSWDRKLARGLVFPDATVDLHGHTLHSAHDLLDAALARAIARGDRVVLLVTGRPPRPESERPHARGAIRAAVGDWLAASRHAAHIASVRGAHPRHGGAGALYLILRRPRGG